MVPESIRVGVIGCGNVMIKGHAPAILSLEQLLPVAAADPTPSRLEEGLAIFGLPELAGYASHIELLEHESPDYVVLAVPPQFRPQIIEDCARANVHVLAEKPLATVPARAWEAVEHMQAQDLYLGMVHNYLYFPEYIIVRDLLANKEIGDLRHIQLSLMGVPDHPGHGEYLPQWRHDPSASGGGILMDLIHVFYVVEFLADSKIVAVQAIIDNMQPGSDQVEDTVLIQLYLEDGYATINLGWGDGPGGLLVTGTEGRLIVQYENYGSVPFDPLERMIVVRQDERQELDLPQVITPGATLINVHQEFADSLMQKRPLRSPGIEGARTLENGVAAYASAVEGKVTSLPLDRKSPVFLHGLAGMKDLEVWQEGPAYRKSLLLLEGGDGNL